VLVFGRLRLGRRRGGREELKRKRRTLLTSVKKRWGGVVQFRGDEGGK
jgi:hypothetical protein